MRVAGNLVLLLCSAVALAAGSRAQSGWDPARELEDVLRGGEYQTQLPGPWQGAFEQGDLRQAAPERDARRRPEGDADGSRRSSGRGPGWTLGGASGLGVLLWVGLGIAVALLIGSLIGRARGMHRDVTVPRDPGGSAPNPGPRALSADALATAEALARQGHVGEAIRLLLKRVLAALGRDGNARVRPSSTSREVLASLSLPEPGRTSLQTMVREVERHLFAGKAPGQEVFEACAREYRQLRGITGTAGA